MLDKLYGIHENALSLKARRMEVLSNNIANADTPGYKARDVDFHKVLSWQLGAGGLETTHSGHLASPHALDNGQVFTIPYNTSVDGNTVEIGLEQAKFGKAAMEYQATLDFLQEELPKFGFSFRSLTGAMTQQQRAKVRSIVLCWGVLTPQLT